MTERSTFTTELVRAMDVENGDLIQLRDVSFWYFLPRRTSKWQKGSRIDLATDWQFVFEVGNVSGNEIADSLEEGLHESFVLLRVSLDRPDSAENKDLFVAMYDRDLVPVQREERS